MQVGCDGGIWSCVRVLTGIDLRTPQFRTAILCDMATSELVDGIRIPHIERAEIRTRHATGRSARRAPGTFGADHHRAKTPIAEPRHRARPSR